MQSAIDKIYGLTVRSRGRNWRQVRSSAYVVVLLVALLWWTRWPSLLPGLIILVVGQIGGTAALLYRNDKLARRLDHLQTPAAGPEEFIRWFDEEQSFNRYLAIYENGLRAAGFAVLAYGFWVPTRSVGIAILMGVGYPALAYFGLERKKRERSNRTLATQRQEMVAALGGEPGRDSS